MKKQSAQLRGLVLHRRAGEIVSINNGELLIEVAQIKGKVVKLVFDASREISIRRYDEKELAQSENTSDD